MSVAKITEIQASSTKSFDDAIQTGITRANKTLRNLTGAWVKGQKVVIDNMSPSDAAKWGARELEAIRRENMRLIG